MNQLKRNQIFERLKKQNPRPTTELYSSSHFELLISVILSQKATDLSVNKATPALFTIANTPKKMLALKETGLKEYIKTIGLFNTKAKNIIKTCEILVNQYEGKVPQTREALEKLPGVGRKTANVILNTAFNHPTIAVDTHVFRVANRTKLAKGKTPFEVEQKLLKVVPKKYQKNAHHWLLLHGRYTCLSRHPQCPICIIQDLCEYPDKTI
ncbi:MAG TPA: endonuclease III [Gammaproteobacteria bacterium]|nr:endonuclease III [Gammaproteobacteria bacterium]